jgi:hypothetical protein
MINKSASVLLAVVDGCYGLSRNLGYGKYAAFLAALLLCLPARALGQQIPALTVLPPDLTASNPALAQRRADLVQERAGLHGKVTDLNARCTSVLAGSKADTACQKEQGELSIALNSHIKKSKDFNADAEPEVKNSIAITNLEALASKLGWSSEKQARLNTELHRLGTDGDPDATGGQVRSTWQDILSRGEDADLVREASQGGGLGFPGAGAQTTHEDCTIFALANATGLPYGVVAARATGLISKEDWRSASEQANPQSSVENQGLSGGEVVMLAESLGQAEVVPHTEFVKTLTAGQPIMLNVVPSDGNVNGGHEVVLTKTFQHGGETWFVMMDSNQGPVKRLFLSSTELSTIQQEQGVVYHAESGTTPALLR